MQSVAVSGNVIALYNKIEASAKRQAFERIIERIIIYFMANAIVHRHSISS